MAFEKTADTLLNMERGNSIVHFLQRRVSGAGPSAATTAAGASAGAMTMATTETVASAEDIVGGVWCATVYIHQRPQCATHPPPFSTHTTVHAAMSAPLIISTKPTVIVSSNQFSWLQ